MSQAMEFTGKLVWVGKIQTIKSQKTGKEFVKRDVAFADDPSEEFPTVLVGTLKKSAKHDNTNLATEANLMHGCKVTFFPDGRFWNDKTTGEKRAMAGNTIWKIEWDDATSDGATSAAEPPPSLDEIANDDMPF